MIIRRPTTRDKAKPIVNGQGMKISPMYISAKTYRNYDNYKESAAYADGWNAAMDAIFPEEAEKRRVERMKKNLRVVPKE